MKSSIALNLLRNLLSSLLIILLLIQCECKPSLPKTSDEEQKSVEPKPRLEDTQPKALPTKITDQMWQEAKAFRFFFLATKLQDLQKEDQKNTKVAYINDMMGNKETALHQAVSPDLAQPNIVQALLERGANPNHLNQDSSSPLALAVRSSNNPNYDLGKNLATIRLLLDAGAHPLLGGDKSSPLAIVIKQYKPERAAIVKLLLAKVSNINVQDAQGNTLLHWAIKEGKEEIVGLLLKKGAKSNIENHSNESPLDLAKKSSNLAIKNLFGV
jgi:ankyrin repeat protein